jgi:hypothetical protein
MARKPQNTTWHKTKRYYESRGYAVVKTEYRDPFTRFVTHDLLGCIDCLALKPNEVIAIQYTSQSNHADRRKKILSLQSAGEPIAHWLTVLPLHIVSFKPDSDDPRIEILGKWSDDIFTTG